MTTANINQPAKLVETSISESAIRLRYADHSDPAQATEWIDLQVKLAPLLDPSDKKQPLGPPERHFLGGVQLAALFQAQDAINTEIRRLREIARQTY